MPLKLKIDRLLKFVIWRFRRLVHLSKYEFFRKPPYVRKYFGLKIFYGRGDYLIWRLSILKAHEPHISRFIVERLPEDALVLDIGANIGLFGFMVLARKNKSTVHLFEPSPVPSEYLELTIAANRMEGRAKLIKAALFSKPGKYGFSAHEGPFSAFDGLLDTKNKLTGKTRTVIVPVTTVDLYAKQTKLSRIDLLKIDAEGAELPILEGSLDVIVRFQPLIIFEIGEMNLSPYGVTAKQIYEFFWNHQYQIVSFSDRKELSFDDFMDRWKKEHEFFAEPAFENIL